MCTIEELCKSLHRLNYRESTNGRLRVGDSLGIELDRLFEYVT